MPDAFVYYTPDQSNFILENSRPRFIIGNRDSFLVRVYHYYMGKGFFCIVLSKALNLLNVGWVIFLSTFLFSFVDYDMLFDKYNLQSSISFQGLNPFVSIGLVIVSLIWIWQLTMSLSDCAHLYEIKQFYERALRIPESALENMEWSTIVDRLVAIPEVMELNVKNPLDVANIIMRKENFLIAMLNKKILDLSIPLPFLKKRKMMTQTLKWSLTFTLFNYVFNSTHQSFNPDFLDETKSRQLADGLRRLFKIVGIVSLLLSPFIFVFLIIYFFFNYGEEIRSQPRIFCAREWSPVARLKFRELNELPHIFQKRLNESYKPAGQYVACFPSEILNIIARFVLSVTGSVVVVLVVIGLWDDSALLKLNIFDFNAFWLLTLCGTLIAVCRGILPDQYQALDPNKIMAELAQHTHYMPASWEGRAHTPEVFHQFSRLFEYKALILLQELLSVLTTPLILLLSLSSSADSVVRFFQECTVSDSTLGCVCRFALFPADQVPSSLAHPAHQAGLHEGKLEKSLLNFASNYPTWKLPEEAERLRMSSSSFVQASSSRASLELPRSDVIPPLILNLYPPDKDL